MPANTNSQAQGRPSPPVDAIAQRIHDLIHLLRSSHDPENITNAGRYSNVLEEGDKFVNHLRSCISSSSNAYTADPDLYQWDLMHGDTTSPREHSNSDVTASRERSNGQVPYTEHLRDLVYDRTFLDNVRAAESKQLTATSHGALNDEWVKKILRNIQHPTLDNSEALFVTPEAASVILDSQTPDIPIFTIGKLFRWKQGRKPLEQIFGYIADLNWTTSVQIPSRDSSEDSFELRTLREIYERFSGGPDLNDPWNVLEMQSPLPSCLPDFLSGENCQLLLRIRDTVLSTGSAGRRSAPVKSWNKWKDVTEWVLMSQGGNNTSAHMDSHGFATWLTVQQGEIGFVWMSRPTLDERREWMGDPQGYTGGQWRYVILKEGQSVFFPSGVIHGVFRLENSLMIGGHILQWTGIVDWLQVVMDEMRNPMITNEEMENAPNYVQIVAELVEAKKDEIANAVTFFEKLKVIINNKLFNNRKKRLIYTRNSTSFKLAKSQSKILGKHGQYLINHTNHLLQLKQAPRQEVLNEPEDTAIHFLLKSN